MIFGLLHRSDTVEHPELAAKLRDLTISWSRYAYHESIVEGDSIGAILDQAAAAGHDYCFLQSSGHLIRESWQPFAANGGDLVSFLKQWASQHEFFVAGSVTPTDDGADGLDTGCLLVDLRKYVELGHPRLSAANLNRSLSIRWLGQELADATLQLAPLSSENAVAFERYLGPGIEDYQAQDANEALTADQRTFLDSLCRQTANARQGVFLWNIESYADVEACAGDFQGPITSLYSVAAGFKPNRILETHGFDDRTRVVFFDYSRNALEVKKCLVEEWDGVDYPDFIRYLFRKFPDPQTYYQLWSDAKPADVEADDLERMWRRELDRWPSERAFQDHWLAYRELRHDYVCCNIMTQPDRLIERVAPGPRAVIWWSNAFFTMFGNWFCGLDQRQRMYETWISQLAARNPELFLFGADYNNISVNGIQAGEYTRSFQEFGGDWLRPCKLHRQAIRS